MERIEAQVLLKNLLHRIRETDGVMQLPGVLTMDEVEALRLLLGDFDHGPSAPIRSAVSLPRSGCDSDSANTRARDLVLSAFDEYEHNDGVRLCFDFGTAMSKATLVRDDDHGEIIETLRLGVPGGQEQIDEFMLISSVYIDDDGILRFGKAAFEKSLLEGVDGSRQRLDSIKRRLSEDGWDEKVEAPYNPTGVSIRYADMVLAYMAYMTWTANCCLEELGYPRLVARRFALPCFQDGPKRREAIERLKEVVGDAQVLADTFGEELRTGLPLQEFMDAAASLRRLDRKYEFVADDVPEPLGVAGSLISWKQRTDNLILVIDVGAGTSDLGLYRIHVDPTREIQQGYEVLGSTRVLTEAGNYLDSVLIEFILAKLGVTGTDPMARSIRGKLNLEIRAHKETLFSEGSAFVLLEAAGRQFDVEIGLDEFRQLPAVMQFGASLRETVVEILEDVDESWVGWVLANPARSLVLVLTGGGASLPMVREVAEAPLTVHGRAVRVALAPDVPNWLERTLGDVASDFTRVAVSLGGARKRLMEGRAASITGGDVTVQPVIGGYYQKG